MKQKDIAVIIAVVAISALVSSFVSSKVFTAPKQRSQQVQVIPAIDSSFPTPDPKYFNPQAIDPTQLIQIGNGTSPTLFNNSSQ